MKHVSLNSRCVLTVRALSNVSPCCCLSLPAAALCLSTKMTSASSDKAQSGGCIVFM